MKTEKIYPKNLKTQQFLVLGMLMRKHLNQKTTKIRQRKKLCNYLFYYNLSYSRKYFNRSVFSHIMQLML